MLKNLLGTYVITLVMVPPPEELSTWKFTSNATLLCVAG